MTTKQDAQTDAGERQPPDPLSWLIEIGRAVASGLDIGEVSDLVQQAWSDAGLGPLRSPAAIEREHGISGLMRANTFHVRLTWCDIDGEDQASDLEVRADSPMDAARVAYMESLDDMRGDAPEALAVVGREVYEVEPVIGVRVVDQDRARLN